MSEEVQAPEGEEEDWPFYFAEVEPGDFDMVIVVPDSELDHRATIVALLMAASYLQKQLQARMH